MEGDRILAALACYSERFRKAWRRTQKICMALHC